MKKKVRVAFIIFIILSFAILILYNFSRSAGNSGMQEYRLLLGYPEVQRMLTDRVTIIIYIFVMVMTCILYLVYEFYQVMYSELADRMTMLDASRTDLQTTYDSIGMYFIEVDTDMTIININNVFAERIGRKKNSIIGQKLEAILGFRQDLAEALVSKIRQTFERNSSERTEIEDAGKIYEAFIFPIHAPGERSRKALVMLSDVTNFRAIERQVLQDNKMAAVGQLAAGVAHEIRNPLGIIRNYCYILKNSAEYDRAVIDKAIASIEKAVEKSGRIIDNLLDFSRISSNKREQVNLYQFLQSILSLEQNILAGKNVHVVIDCPTDIELITLAESLEIILINLIINAVDAMPNGGYITISAKADNETVRLSVADTGIGIPEENLDSIFNPFFTTKEKRDGSGLGLYIVYNETEKLGGKIDVESRTGAGTTFILTFPMQRSNDDDQ